MGWVFFIELTEKFEMSQNFAMVSFESQVEMMVQPFVDKEIQTNSTYMLDTYVIWPSMYCTWIEYISTTYLFTILREHHSAVILNENLFWIITPLGL